MRRRMGALLWLGLVVVLGLGGCEDLAIVEVDPEDVPLLSVEFEAAELMLDALGATETLTPRILDARGAPVDPARVLLRWTSEDPGVVGVDGEGRLLSVGNGTTRVRVQVQGRTPVVLQGVGYLGQELQGILPVTVTQRVASLGVRHPGKEGSGEGELQLRYLGARAQLGLEVLDPRSVPVVRPFQALWQTDAADVVRVDAEGQVAAVGEGSARISVTVDGVTASHPVVVDAAFQVQACAVTGAASMEEASERIGAKGTPPACGTLALLRLGPGG